MFLQRPQCFDIAANDY